MAISKEVESRCDSRLAANAIINTMMVIVCTSVRKYGAIASPSISKLRRCLKCMNVASENLLVHPPTRWHSRGCGEPNTDNSERQTDSAYIR